MSNEMVGILGLVLLLVLIGLRVWIGAAMAIAAFAGIFVINGWNAATGVLVTAPFSQLDNYVMTAIPMFTVMGIVFAETGMGRKLFDCCNIILGRRTAGVCSATIVATGFMSAVIGSDHVASVVMTKIAYPELKRLKVNDAFACATIATGAPLAILLPPSMALILYGMITEQSIAQLFAAAMIPGLISIVTMIIVAQVRVRLNPSLCPKGDVYTTQEKIKSLVNIIPVVILFVVVLGGIYSGLCTPTEAGALGTLVAFLIALVGRTLTFKKFIKIMLDSVLAVGFVMFLIVGVYVFIRFVALSRLPFVISNFIIGLSVSPSVVLFVVAIMYLIISMFLPQIPLLVLTVPIIAPAMVALGFSYIWFGVFVVMMQSLGSITPPIGMNVFIVGGIAKVPIDKIYRTALPYITSDLAVILCISLFPQLALWIPSLLF